MKEKIVFISIALLIQIIQLFKNRTKIIAKTTLLNIARQLSALSPTDLIKNFDKLQDYGICIGNAFSSQKVTSILKPQQSVVISKLYEMNNFNFRGELQQFKKLIRIKRPTFFTLNDKFSSIPILETVSLPTITTRFQMKQNTVNKTSYINIVIYLINFFKNIQLPLASQTSFLQSYLPQGTKVAVLGKYKRESAGNISCDKPIMMASSKNRIIEKLQYKVNQLKFQKFILIFGITFCLGFGLRLFYTHYMEQRKKKQDPINKLEDTIYVKSKVCFNCHEKLSNFIIQKCGHLSLCKECKDKVKMCGQCKIKENKGLQLFAC